MWRKEIPLAVFVAMSTDKATVENRMEIPLETRNNTTM